MKVIRTAAHARNTAPPFGLVAQDEILKLRQLPGWARWLFLELCCMSEYSSGLVVTSYAQLVALLDCDQPGGGKRLDAPTLKQVRTALDWLDAMGLAIRSKADNEAHGVLKIHIRRRAGIGASGDFKGRGKGRVKNAQTTDEHRAQPEVVHSKGQGLGQVYQNQTSIDAAPPVDNLATGRVRQKLRQQADELRGRVRRKKKGPPGGQNMAPTGHAPQGAFAGMADVLDAAGITPGPPRGAEEDAPPVRRFRKGLGGP